MKTRSLLVHWIRAFVSEQRGNVTIEAAILIPIMVWGYLAMFTIFDAFRQNTTQQKAAFTVSDLISRQATPLDAEFIDGAYLLFQNLSRIAGDPGMRVTVAKYDFEEEEYAVVWSRSRGAKLPLESDVLTTWNEYLPVLPQDDQIIIVETTAAYQPVFRVGLNYRNIGTFVFTRPRYAKQVCFNEICDLPKTEVPEAGPDETA